MARIVVLDDEALSCNIISDLLITRGHEVKCFTNPAKGILHICDAPPDVVIVDMLIAGMWGDHILQKIMHMNKPPKFIGISYSWPGNLILTDNMLNNSTFVDKTQFICRLSGNDPINELNEVIVNKSKSFSRRASQSKSQSLNK